MRHNILFASLGLLLATVTAVTGQNDSGIIEQRAIVVEASDDGEGGSSIMTFEMSGSDGPMVLADSLNNAFDFSMGTAPSNLSILNNSSVQDDLQLVDEQIEQINEINREFGQKIKEQMGLMKDENGNFNFQPGVDFAGLVRDLKQQQQDQITNILLPNQQKRLEQVARQMRVEKLGTSKALAGKLAEELGISDEQKKKIRDTSKELKQELDEKIAKLRAKAKEQLLDELTPQQKEKLEELMGEEFIQKKPQRRKFDFRPNFKSDSKNF